MPFLDKDTPLSARIYIVSVIALGVAVIASSIAEVSKTTGSEWAWFFLLVILTAVMSLFPVRIPASSHQQGISLQHQGIILTFSDLFLFTAMLIFGPAVAVCLVSTDSALANLKVRSSIKSWGKAAFNICQSSLVTFLATHLFWQLYGGSPPIIAIFSEPPANRTVLDLWRLLPCLLLTTLVFYVANSAAVGTAMALVTRQRLWTIWRKNFLWTSLSNIAGALIAAVIVLVYSESPQADNSLLGVAIAGAMIVATYVAYRFYLDRIETLMRSRQFWQSILDSVSAYIAILDEDGRIVAVNRVWEAFARRRKLVGPVGEVGDNFLVLLERLGHTDEKVAKRIIGGIRQTATNQISGFSLEYSCGRDRRREWFALQVNRFIDDDQIRVVVEFADITARMNLEEQLRHAQKMEAIGRLAGGVAHDFNNILTIISGYGTFLLEGVGGNPKLRRHVDTILEAADRAGAVTKQLLAFSRKQVLEPRVVSLNTLVGETEKLLRRLIGEDIELVTTLDPDAGRIRVDPGQFAQVLINLAVNSRDAMPSGGQIRVETCAVNVTEGDLTRTEELKSGRYAVLRVRDSGDGMKPEVLDHIFEPFYTTKEKGKGTGLGLSTVYGIVKQSGGHIDVSSEPGKGAVFEIFLPIVVDGEALTPHELPADPRGERGVDSFPPERPPRPFAAPVAKPARRTIAEDLQFPDPLMPKKSRG